MAAKVNFVERARHVQDFIDKHGLRDDDIVCALIYTVHGMKIVLQLDELSFNELFDKDGPAVIVGELEITRHKRDQNEDRPL